MYIDPNEYFEEHHDELDEFESELERLEDYCKENNFTVTTFTVADDTLTVNVV